MANGATGSNGSLWLTLDWEVSQAPKATMRGDLERPTNEPDKGRDLVNMDCAFTNVLALRGFRMIN